MQGLHSLVFLPLLLLFLGSMSLNLISPTPSLLNFSGLILMATLLLLWIIIMSLILLRFMTLMTNLLSLRPLALPYPRCLIYPPLILLSALSMPWIFTFMRRPRLVLPSPHPILLIMSLLHTWTLGPWPVPLTVFLTCGIFSPSMVLPPLFVLLMPHPIIPLVLVTCVSPFSALPLSPLFGRFTRPVSRQPLFCLLLLPLTLAVLDILALPISMAPVALLRFMLSPVVWMSLFLCSFVMVSSLLILFFDLLYHLRLSLCCLLHRSPLLIFIAFI